MVELLHPDDPEMVDGPIGARQIARLAAAMTDVVAGWLAANPWMPVPSPRLAGPAVRRFLRVYPARPITDNASGSRFNTCAWLFALTRLFDPRLIVECGTHRGQSAWLFRQAAPGARITTFDITHEALAHRVDGVAYRLGDWNDADPVPGTVDSDGAIAFFDDHIDQARRVCEAWAHGFRWLIFDDNLPSHLLFVTGRPPAPTISMLYETTWRNGERLTWSRHGRPRSIDMDQEACERARALIADWSIVPDLRPVTGYRPQTGLTVVRLVDRDESRPGLA